MHTYATTAPITAVLEIPAGHIRLIATDRTETSVEVLPADPAAKRDAKAAEHTGVSYTDGTLRIETAPAARRALGPSGALEITVRLPAGSRIQAELATGELRGVGRLGEVTLEAAQATVKLDETTTAHLTLSTGEITIGRLTGPAEISTRKGAIEITEAVRGPLTLHTDAGPITVGTAHTTSATLDATTTYGRIHNTLTNTAGPNPDLLEIHATTSHGDITARSL